MRISVLLAAVLLPVLSAAYKIGGSEFCEGPYALCAGAPCQAISGNSTHATCTCALHNGLNTAGSSCADRVKSLLSTYSIIQLFPSSSQPPLYTFPCTGSNAGQFAECIDAPCTTSSDGTTTCTCRLDSGTNHYLGPQCPTSASQTSSLCQKLRSSGSSTTPPGSSGSGQSAGNVLPQFYGIAPDHPACSAPGS